MENHHVVHCSLCNSELSSREAAPALLTRKAVSDIIKRDYPNWNLDSVICFSCLNRYRAEYLQHALEDERGELSNLEIEVMQSLKDEELLSQNLNTSYQQTLTFGERLSDKMADFGGSWRFLILFAFVLAVWITFNSLPSQNQHFDPFPFILLNLVLSCIAAVQAPIIMMSQNRQEARDRLRAENDYRINLKAELEIRHLHLKLDQLMTHQWQRLLEIQQIQTELMEELTTRESQ